MASIFQGMSYYGNGFIYAIQDKPRTPITIFTTSNVKDGNFNYSSSSKKTRHTVAVVRYNDKTNFYKPTIEYVEDIQSMHLYGIRELDLTAFGTTSRGQAVRFGRWALASEKYQTETVTFSTSYEALYLKPGDLVSIYDQNRKVGRVAGRLKSSYTNDHKNRTTLNLDTNLMSQNILTSGYNYQISILCPSYNYEQTLVDEGLDSQDIPEIRKSVIVSGTFVAGVDTYTNPDNLTRINLNDVQIKIPNDKAIWAIESISGDLNNYSLEDYSILNIVEKETNEFEISAISYMDKKYLEIESGLNFERTPDFYLAAPQTASALSMDTIPNYNTQSIQLSIATSNYSGTTSFHVYGKFGRFETQGLPERNYIIGTFPIQSQLFNYQPSGTGQYYVRVYGYNDNSELYGNTYMSGDVSISRYYPIRNLIISQLKLDNETTISSNTIYNNTGLYTNDSPQFSWRADYSGIPYLQPNYNYRVTIRTPSRTNLPTGNILYEKILDKRLQAESFTFDLETNSSITGGPFRSYDLVVEAVDAERNTSAGNSVEINNRNEQITVENWINNYGYETIYVNNEKPPMVSLSYPVLNETGNYISNQWIDQNGSIHFKFTSGYFPTDIAGGYVFSSTGLFSGQNITGYYTGTTGTIPSIYPIYTGEFDFDFKSNYFSVPAQAIHNKTGYVAIAFYDAFDVVLKENGVNIISGLNISNVIPIVPSGYDYNMTIGNKLDIKNSSNNIDVTSLITVRSGSYWISKAVNWEGIEYIVASKSDG
jgi:hypothetical protein